METPPKIGTPKAPRPASKPPSRTSSTTSMHDAAANGDLELLKTLLEQLPNVKDRKYSDTSPLHEAAYADQEDCAKLLIEKGFGVNQTDLAGASPLHLAALNGALKATKFLLKNGANIFATDNEKNTPLHQASASGNLELVELILITAASQPNYINLRNDAGQTALWIATSEKQAKVANFLVSKGAEIDCADDDKLRPLHKAAEFGILELVSLFLSKGASPNDEDKHGNRPLHLAAEQGHLSVIKLLLEHGANPALKDDQGYTPLHNAAYWGHYQCCNVLYDKVSILDEDNVTNPLHLAAFKGRTKILQLFLSKIKNVNAKDEEGATALHKACFMGHVPITELLLEKGAKVDAQDGELSTPLHSAAVSGHTECMVKLLAKAKQNGQTIVSIVDKYGNTALHDAAKKGYVECIQVLVMYASSLKAPGDGGNTPLHFAVQKGNKVCASLLIKKGSSVNATNTKGRAPLHLGWKHPGCIQRLIKAGADINAKDKEGNSPLYFAVKNDAEESARLLIFHGADINAENLKGEKVTQLSKVLNERFLKECTEEKKNSEEAAFLKLLKKPIKKFNEDTEAGINMLFEGNIVPKTPSGIAKALFLAADIDKGKLGKYLGDKKNETVLKEYVNRMHFENYEIYEGLRLYLNRFRLPGEAMQIDRVLDAFSHRFHQDNPSKFTDADTVYLLSFSIIMAHTDIHNPNIKKENKITKQQWIKTSHRLEKLKALDTEILSNIFDQIGKEAIKLETDTTGYGRAEKKGYLVKQGGRIKTWKKRWFVLSDNCLYYFKNHENVESPIGIIPLENLDVRIVEQKKKFLFELFQPDQAIELKAAKFDSKGNIAKGHHESYPLMAPSEEEMKEWVSALKENIFKNPLLELFNRNAPGQKFSLRESSGSGGQGASPSPVSSMTESTSPAVRKTVTIQKTPSSSVRRVNFKNIHQYATFCRMLGVEKKQLEKQYAFNFKTVKTIDNLQLLLFANNETKKQYIVFGDKTWTPKKLAEDFAFWKENSTKKSGEIIWERYGHLKSLHEKIFDEIKEDLKPNFLTFIVAHSLASVISIPLARICDQKGMKIKKIVAFGMPKFVSAEDFEKSSEPKYRILRVVDVRDPASVLFPGCVGFGREVMLLSEKFHTAPDQNFLSSSIEEFDQDILTEDEDCHSMEYYIGRIAPKIKESILISYHERAKYAQ